MNIIELVERLRTAPKEFDILGKGAHCLALTHRENPNDVLLLEDGNKNGPHHARAAGFARQNDCLLSASLSSYNNNNGLPFLHPALVESAASGAVGQSIYLHIGNGTIFTGHSMRLIRRIPGKALHYLDFVDPHNGLSNAQMDALARDIAAWMYTLHHQVSTAAMIKNKLAKQFHDAGKSLLDRPLASDKYKIFVIQNVAEIDKLNKGLNEGTLYPDYAQKITNNLDDAGINFKLLEQSAHLLKRRLETVLPTDRIGLCHSDIHPANIIVSDNFNAVNGVCDWMSAGFDAQSIDFAGLGLAHGLLPKVLKYYRKREKESGVAHPINQEAAYAYAAMRNLYIVVKAVKNGYGEGCAARVAWEQVGECFSCLSRINSAVYGQLARRHKHQKLPPLRMPNERQHFKSHPSLTPSHSPQ
ncbi:MAG: phosphotransferase [Alphaproteobacteria bacterium]|nr:phosphotransferase [Alphaproteobacteria bacterium]